MGGLLCDQHRQSQVAATLGGLADEPPWCEPLPLAPNNNGERVLSAYSVPAHGPPLRTLASKPACHMAPEVPSTSVGGCMGTLHTECSTSALPGVVQSGGLLSLSPLIDISPPRLHVDGPAFPRHRSTFQGSLFWGQGRREWGPSRS